MFSNLQRTLRAVKIGSRLVHKKGLPVSLIFFVTSRCNLLCTHCFYWEELNKRKNELTLEEIRKVSQSLPNLLTVSLTGGEPFLRPDLPDIAEIFEKNSHVRNIQIPSNGLLVEKTLTSVEQIMQKVRYARVSTGVSLDGPKEIHNQIRQNPASFDLALETLKELKKLKVYFPNLSVGVALTVSSANQNQLNEFYRFIEEKLQPDALTITLVRGDPIDPSLKKVDLDIYQNFSRRVIHYREKHRLTDTWKDRLVIAKERETYDLIREAAGTTRRISPCYGGQLIGVLSEIGDVSVCETLDKKMGNIRNFGCNFASLWKGQLAEEGRLFQKKLQCQCTYECAMSVNTLFNPARAFKIFCHAFHGGNTIEDP